MSPIDAAIALLLLPWDLMDGFVNLWPWPAVLMAFLLGVLGGVLLVVAFLVISGVVKHRYSEWLNEKRFIDLLSRIFYLVHGILYVGLLYSLFYCLVHPEQLSGYNFSMITSLPDMVQIAGIMIASLLIIALVDALALLVAVGCGLLIGFVHRLGWC